jgi:hypothetical protein
MARRGLIVLTTALTLSACGGVSDGNGANGTGSGNPIGGGAGGGGPGAGSTADDISVNAARVADLNGLRAQCGGTALTTVASLTPLIISSVKHAGWQAQYDAAFGGAHLDHEEPDQALSLYVNNLFYVRIEAANGGQDIAGWTAYDENIASQAGTPAMDSLWNTVYHRLPMMRTQVTSVGYGDMALARLDYPAAGIPTLDPWGNTPPGNGYATLDFTGYATPAISPSYWPGSNLTGVPAAFNTTTEEPDPLPASSPYTTVGPPLHLVAPTLDNFTSISVTLTYGGTNHIPVHLIVGGTATPGTVGGDASADTPALGIPPGSTQNDLNPGEIFILPLAPGNAGLNPSTTYTWSITAVDSSPTSFTVGPVTFTTAP